MTVNTLIFPFGDVKMIGDKGICFRATTSIRKSGKQSKEISENYETMFYDCKTFNPDVIKVIKSAAYKDGNKVKFKGIDISGFAELNVWTNKETNVTHKDLVFNIQSATIHEKKTTETLDINDFVEIPF